MTYKFDECPECINYDRSFIQGYDYPCYKCYRPCLDYLPTEYVNRIINKDYFVLGVGFVRDEF